MVGLVKLLLLWYLQTNQNLKNYLLVLAKYLNNKYLNNRDIWYCENAICDKKGTYNIEIELVSNTNDFGNDSDFREVLLEFSENIPKATNEIPQFLTNFKNSKIPNEKISFSPPKDYPSLYKVYGYFKREVRDTFDRYLWHGYSKIPQEKRIAKIKEQMNEEIKIDPPFCNYRVDSEQNRKINEIVEGLKSGKIIGKKIISNAFDLSVSYCFITLDGLKNLKERLFIDIINVINQKKRVALNHAQIDDIQYKEGVALDYALINDIKHNLLDNTFHFIFDIDLHLIDD